MAPKSSHYRMADRLAGGQLERILHGFTDAGLKPDAIAARLYADHGIEGTGVTISSWLTALSSPLPETSAS
jgi:hypothetical protein